MKRKVYVTARERKADQIKGFLAVPIVNVSLWITAQVIDAQMAIQAATTDQASFTLVRVLSFSLPWLVNGSVLALALIFRPQFGVGYLAFIALAITAAAVLNAVFVAACFVYSLSTVFIGDLAIVLFAILMAAGLCGLGVAALILFRRWRSSNGSTSHQGDEGMN